MLDILNTALNNTKAMELDNICKLSKDLVQHRYIGAVSYR
jgi:hypothetical protein